MAQRASRYDMTAFISAQGGASWSLPKLLGMIRRLIKHDRQVVHLRVIHKTELPNNGMVEPF